VRWYISGYDGTGANHGEFSDAHTSQDDRSGPNRRTSPNQNRTQFPVSVGLERSIRIDCPGQSVVCQNHARSDKDTICDSHAVVDTGAILDLDAIADPDIEVDICSLADDAVITDPSPLPNLSLMPDAGASTYDSLGGYIGCRVNIG
jgi:hypothetical protein